jgi:D-alanine transaminase
MAKKAGVDDAWFTEDGFVTEGTSNNAYIVKGKIITRQLSNDILHGITRAAVLRYAAEAQMQIEERPSPSPRRRRRMRPSSPRPRPS